MTRVSPPLDGEGVEKSIRIAFATSLMNANAGMRWLDDDSMDEMISSAWVGFEEPIKEAFARAATISTPREDEVERHAKDLALATELEQLGCDEAAKRLRTLTIWACGPNGVRWYIEKLQEAQKALATLTPREQIRAEAFESLREPTEAMIEAACEARNLVAGTRWTDGTTEGVQAIERMLAEKSLIAAIRALSSLPAPSSREQGMEEAWQPIETFAEPTALSSGNGVLVAEENGTVGEAYYRNFGDESDGWWWANTSWGDYPEPDRPDPTHWQPLPEPPALSLQDKT